MIAALIEKDLKQFFRNQFNALITVLGLVAYIVIFLILPDSVDESLKLAVYLGEDVPDQFTMIFSEGIEAVMYETEEAMIAAIEAGEYPVGMTFDDAALASIGSEESGTVPVYYAPGTTEEIRRTYEDVLSVLFNTILIQFEAPVRVNETIETLGPDTVNEPTPLRNRLLPFLLLGIFAIEMMGLSGLIVEEIETKTAQGILTTPLTLAQFFSAKAIIGVGLAFVQTLIMLGVIGQLFTAPLILILTLLISGLFISGLAFVIASISQDYMTVLGWSILFIIGLMIPAITLIAPGLSSSIVNFIPSYYMIDTVHQAINLNASLADVAGNLAILGAIGIGLLILGSLLLRRRLNA